MKKIRMKLFRAPGLKRFLPRTLFGRSLLILVVPVFLIQVLTTYAFFDRHWDRMTSRLAYAVAGEIAVLIDTIEKDPAVLAREDFVSLGQHLSLNVSFDKGQKLQEAQGKRSVRSWESMSEEALLEELGRQIDLPYRVYANFRDHVIRVTVQLPDGVLRVERVEARAVLLAAVGGQVHRHDLVRQPLQVERDAHAVGGAGPPVAVQPEAFCRHGGPPAWKPVPEAPGRPRQSTPRPAAATSATAPLSPRPGARCAVRWRRRCCDRRGRASRCAPCRRTS